MRSTTVLTAAFVALVATIVDAAPRPQEVVPYPIGDEDPTPSATFRVTVCPRPTGTNNGFIDPKSNLTFGCEPGFVCDPPKPEGCNFWAEPPTDDYVCPPDRCIAAPPYNKVQWGDDDTAYYPPSDGYFALNPNAFGLSYEIFEEDGNHESQADLSQWPPPSTTSSSSSSTSSSEVTTTSSSTTSSEITTTSSSTTSRSTSTTTITTTITITVDPPPVDEPTRQPSTSTVFVTETIDITTTVPFEGADAAVVTEVVQMRVQEQEQREAERKRAAEKLARRAMHWWKARDLTTPDICFDDCDGAWKVAESVGKTSELCQEDGDFMINHDSCTSCVDTNSDESKDNPRDYVEPVFAQFLNYCDARDPDPTPDPSGPDSQISSTSVEESTTSQEDPESTSFTPDPPTTTSTSSTTSEEDEPTTTTSSEDEPITTTTSEDEDEPSTTTESEDEPTTTAAGPTTTSSEDEPSEGPATTTQGEEPSPTDGGQGGGVAPAPVPSDDDGDDDGDDAGNDDGEAAPVPAPAPEDVTSAVITLVDTTTDASGAEITTTRLSTAVFGTASDGSEDIAISTGVTLITTTTTDTEGNVITTTSESALWGVASAVPDDDNSGDDDDGVVFIPPQDDDDDEAQPTPGSPEEVPIAGASGLVGSSMAFTLFVMFAVLA